MNPAYLRLMQMLNRSKTKKAKPRNLAEVEADAEKALETMFRAADEKAGIKTRFTDESRNG